jgi:hypothetical protein
MKLKCAFPFQTIISILPPKIQANEALGVFGQRDV